MDISSFQLCPREYEYLINGTAVYTSEEHIFICVSELERFVC